MFFFFLRIFISVLFVLIRVAFVTLLERKILALCQLRLGPNKVIFKGVFQPLIDGVKLLCKGIVTPIRTLRDLLILFSVLVIFVIVLLWRCLFCFPFHSFYLVGFLTLMVVLGRGVYGVLIIGYRSASKYSLVGGIRACRQTVRYEVRLALVIFSIVVCSRGIRLWGATEIAIILFPVWFIRCLSEVNRAPFDFAEGERELIRGFNVEFGGYIFAYVFVAEYGSLVCFSWFRSVAFCGGRVGLVFVLIYLFLLIRVSFPRFRYDKLISFCWIRILPRRVFLRLRIYCISGV